jgi:hypothetical protein
MGRTSIRLTLDDRNRDYTYYRDKGWFQSDYYYPTRLGVLKRAAGSFFDSMATSGTRKRVGVSGGGNDVEEEEVA